MVSLEGKISKKFPRKFLWGSATSAYQVEGGNSNSDWEQWEVKAGRACDHYNRFEEDFDIAKSLNQNAHRLSIEWARVEPEKGKFDDEEIEHYRQVLKSLQKRKIKPLVTLHHFTNPVWVAERGGWENKDTISYFESYVRFVVTQLSDLCDFWITINEPAVYVSAGYLYGRWPPQYKDPLKAYLVARHLIKAHQGAYRTIHKIQPKAKVGMAYVLGYLRSPVPFDPLSYIEKLFIKGAKWQDFIGINYYRAVGITQDLPKTDIGWSIYPHGLYENLVSLKEEFDLPIYITENGIADADDDQRADFIADHLAATLYAIRDGVDVRGYFYWSLLDNFEWAYGFGPRFGLVEVDYKTMARKVRPSAQVYSRIAKKNSLKVS
ncbi:MAG TPA: glycoside hydrolase family 1 protein [candidate division WWE3 bacterium]|uniref:Glycoside hydrolase family 1 protein n=1 Tax=candidate division WWE3 bacterium TaxID=2053526 RepID=A0A7C1SPB1_UNCKA|nr:glycoside hydrolase family 1 protein [candidate division WWE3 bacterium]